MAKKKESNKFTIQFNPADPQHAQTIDILNQQGRRKAQFITNAVMHYLHCTNTPNIPQTVPIDTAVIETIVRRIMEEQVKNLPVPKRETVEKQSQPRITKTESIHYDEAAELLGEEGVAAIANSLAMFKK